MNDHDYLNEEIPAVSGCPSLGPRQIPSGADGVEPLARTDYENVIADFFQKCNEAFIHAPQQKEARHWYFKTVFGDIAEALASVVPTDKVVNVEGQCQHRKYKDLALHDLRTLIAKTPATVVMEFTLNNGRRISAEIHDKSTAGVAEAAIFDGDNIVCRINFFNYYQGRNWMFPIVRRACNGVLSKAGKKGRYRKNKNKEV